MVLAPFEERTREVSASSASVADVEKESDHGINGASQMPCTQT